MKQKADRGFLKEKSAEITIFAIIEKSVDIILSLLTGMIVIRFLNIDDYGIKAAMSGYATVINLIRIAPIDYVYKEYGKLDRNKFDEAVSSFVDFEKLKAAVFILIYLAVGIVLSLVHANPGFLIVAIANGVSESIRFFGNIDRCVLELDYEQKNITRIIFWSRALKFAITIALVIYPSLWVLLIRDIGMSIVERVAFSHIAKDKYHKIKVELRTVAENVKKALTSFCVANHLSGILVGLIYESDTMFLSLFWNESIVGKYGIALTCLSYFNPMFEVFHKNTIIELGHSHSRDNDLRIVRKYLKLSCLFSIISFIGYILFGKIGFYIFTGDHEITKIVYQYGVYIFGGACIYNFIRPLTAYIFIRGNINHYLVTALLPSTLFSVALYLISSKYFGAMGIAVSNVYAYSFWTLLVLIYYCINRNKMQLEI